MNLCEDSNSLSDCFDEIDNLASQEHSELKNMLIDVINKKKELLKSLEEINKQVYFQI